MSHVKLHGIVTHDMNQGRKTDYLFRLSIKGVIFNDGGHVLVVKESGRDFWDLPGGGMDHGETIKDAIAREFREEVGLDSDFDFSPIHVEDPKLLARSAILQVRMIFHVSPTGLRFGPGDDGDEIMFVDPESFSHAEHFRERQIHEYAKLAAAKTT